MEETKLSEKERQLLEPFYETDLYQVLKTVLERWGNGISRVSAEQSTDFQTVMYNRGKLDMLKQLHKFIKSTNEKGRKSSRVKPK